MNLPFTKTWGTVVLPVISFRAFYKTSHGCCYTINKLNYLGKFHIKIFGGNFITSKNLPKEDMHKKQCEHHLNLCKGKGIGH